MSIDATKYAAAATHPDGSPLGLGEAFVLVALAFHHNPETGQTNPAHSKIAAFTRMTEQGVGKALKALETSGVIAIHRTKRAGNAPGTSRYTFPLAPACVAVDKTVEPKPSLVSNPNLVALQKKTNPNQVSREPKPRLVVNPNPVGVEAKPGLGTTTLEQELNKNLEQEREQGVAIAAAAPRPAAAATTGKLTKAKATDLEMARLRARYFELFACPTFPNARSRLMGDLSKAVAGGYPVATVLAYLEAVGTQHPDALRTGLYLPLANITPDLAVFEAAGLVLADKAHLTSAKGQTSGQATGQRNNATGGAFTASRLSTSEDMAARRQWLAERDARNDQRREEARQRRADRPAELSAATH